ncbi:hypothetical protein [Massiliimalia massiliensis]|uniref:hypothetical protein n=1 Tax=Massiliimalia massiliensis TaxID=1852384 RepID=UPI000986C221|nr:hypothetical protein [Massiliimalia massiliensis]
MTNSKSGKKTTLSNPISKHKDDSSKSKAAKIKKKLIILKLLVLVLCIIVIGSIIRSLLAKPSDNEVDSSIKFNMNEAIILTPLEDYRNMLNDDRMSMEIYKDRFGEIPEFERTNPDDDSLYNLYVAKITDTLKMYIVAYNENHSIAQVRWVLDNSGEDITSERLLAEDLFETTIVYEYGDSVQKEDEFKELENAMGAIALETASDSDKTYKFKDDIYRIRKSGNIITYYFTDVEYDHIEEMYIKITPDVTYDIIDSQYYSSNNSGDSKGSVTTDTKEGVENKIRGLINEEFENTDIISISIIDDFGTEENDDYVAIISLRYNQENNGIKSKKVLGLYNTDLAAYIGTEIPNVEKLTITWEVPHLENAAAKRSYERKGEWMQTSDEHWDPQFNSNK